MSALRLLLLTPNLDNNSLGRTWCLWLLARHLGHEVQVASVKGERVRPPLASSEMAEVCRRVLPVDAAGVPDPVAVELARWSDVLVAVKPVENSFGLGRLLSAATGRPLLPTANEVSGTTTAFALAPVTSFGAVRDIVEDYRDGAQVTAFTSAGLLDRLARAEAAAATGSETRTIAYLDQLAARALNQIKGDAADIAARDTVVAHVRSLIGYYRAVDED